MGKTISKARVAAIAAVSLCAALVASSEPSAAAFRFGGGGFHGGFGGFRGGFGGFRRGLGFRGYGFGLRFGPGLRLSLPWVAGRILSVLRLRISLRRRRLRIRRGLWIWLAATAGGCIGRPTTDTATTSAVVR
jgi:hypothetical protein